MKRGWECLGALNVPGRHRVSVLPDGTVLVVGGTTSVDTGPAIEYADQLHQQVDPSQLGMPRSLETATAHPSRPTNWQRRS